MGSSSSPDTWKAAFLGTGGVAWFHLIDSANGTLAAHTGKATFWNEETKTALRIDAHGLNDTHIGSSFTRIPEGGIGYRISASDRPLTLRYDKDMHRRRYLTSRNDVWQDIQRRSPRTRRGTDDLDARSGGDVSRGIHAAVRRRIGPRARPHRVHGLA